MFEKLSSKKATPNKRPEMSDKTRNGARRLLAAALDANKGFPELAKRNPELAQEFRDETKAIADCRQRAAIDPNILDMRLD